MPTADREPAREPGSPLPVLSVPLADEAMHLRKVPVVVSVTVNWPDDAWMSPPGWMVQVPAARAAGTPRAATSAVAPATASMRTFRLLIAVSRADRTRPPQPRPSLVPW